MSRIFTHLSYRYPHQLSQAARYWSGQVVCLHDLYDWSLLHQMVFICDPLVPATLKYSFVPTPGWWDITLLRAADGTRPCQTQTEAVRLCIMNISRIVSLANCQGTPRLRCSWQRP